jgi:hypothetical protein
LPALKQRRNKTKRPTIPAAMSSKNRQRGAEPAWGLAARLIEST